MTECFCTGILHQEALGDQSLRWAPCNFWFWPLIKVTSQRMLEEVLVQHFADRFLFGSFRHQMDGSSVLPVNLCSRSLGLFGFQTGECVGAERSSSPKFEPDAHSRKRCSPAKCARKIGIRLSQFSTSCNDTAGRFAFTFHTDAISFSAHL
jgi:hypothetical protein